LAASSNQGRSGLPSLPSRHVNYADLAMPVKCGYVVFTFGYAVAKFSYVGLRQLKTTCYKLADDPWTHLPCSLA